MWRADYTVSFYMKHLVFADFGFCRGPETIPNSYQWITVVLLWIIPEAGQQVCSDWVFAAPVPFIGTLVGPRVPSPIATVAILRQACDSLSILSGITGMDKRGEEINPGLMSHSCTLPTSPLSKESMTLRGAKERGAKTLKQHTSAQLSPCLVNSSHRERAENCWFHQPHSALQPLRPHTGHRAGGWVRGGGPTAELCSPIPASPASLVPDHFSSPGAPWSSLGSIIVPWEWKYLSESL